MALITKIKVPERFNAVHLTTLFIGSLTRIGLDATMVDVLQDILDQLKKEGTIE